jgi:hypothetical protein
MCLFVSRTQQLEQVFSDGETTVMALADGCGWGERKREAAKRASSSFVSTVQEGMGGLKDVKVLQ